MSRGVWVAAHIILEAGVEAVVEAIVIVAEGQFYYVPFHETKAKRGR